MVATRPQLCHLRLHKLWTPCLDTVPRKLVSVCVAWIFYVSEWSDHPWTAWRFEWPSLPSVCWWSRMFPPRYSWSMMWHPRWFLVPILGDLWRWHRRASQWNPRPRWRSCWRNSKDCQLIRSNQWVLWSTWSTRSYNGLSTTWLYLMLYHRHFKS